MIKKILISLILFSVTVSSSPGDALLASDLSSFPSGEISTDFVPASSSDAQSTQNNLTTSRYEALRTDLIQKLIFSYAGTLNNVDPETILRDLRGIDPHAGRTWEQIISCWERVNADDFVNTKRLPDDLPTDNSLCIIVLGYGLYSNGTMRDELILRLNTALSCAEQYPNAYVLLTGGPTAVNEPKATEADKMAEWLLAHNVSVKRLIVENKSMTSSENALFSYEILKNEYPQVKNIVIVTSDYHVPLGCLLFQTQFWLDDAPSSQDSPLMVVANAGADVPGTSFFSVESQASWLWNLVSLQQ